MLLGLLSPLPPVITPTHPCSAQLCAQASTQHFIPTALPVFAATWCDRHEGRHFTRGHKATCNDLLKSRCLGLTPGLGPAITGASFPHHPAPCYSLLPDVHPSHASLGQQTPASEREKKRGDNRAPCQANGEQFQFLF